jgi:hypothetical protein
LKQFYLAAILMMAACAWAGGCLSPHEFRGGASSDTAKLSTSVADAVISKLGPFSTELSRQAAVVAAEEILAKRRAEGKDENAPLNTDEWMKIAGAIAVGLLGLNTYREKTRKKALGKT